MKEKKSWKEKLLDSHGLPKVEKLTDDMSKKWGEGILVVPAPIEVDEIMKKVPEGKLITTHEIREIVAKKHHGTVGCPLTCGIFAWIAAHAAEEDREEGKKDFTSYWRTLKSGGVINEKYPGGIEKQKKLLEKEGHVVVQKGKKYIVSDYQNNLAKL